MKLGILLAVALLLLFYFVQKPADRALETEKTSRVGEPEHAVLPQAKAQRRPPVRPIQSLTPTLQPPKQLAPPPRAESSSVLVRVKNGMAIAEGDILMGKINETLPSDRAQISVSPLHFWDSSDIPYAINQNIPPEQKKAIEVAIAYFQQNTPVRFVPLTDQSDALVFEAGKEHCLSALGKLGGLQPIRLNKECGTQEILHELMHAFGFPHEQSRLDRDQYLEILWSNIEEQYQDQFQILPEVWMEALRGSSFDPQSVMMYGPKLFAKSPGLLTMRSKGELPIAPASRGLSTEDLARIKRLFHAD